MPRQTGRETLEAVRRMTEGKWSVCNTGDSAFPIGQIGGSELRPPDGCVPDTSMNHLGLFETGPSDQAAPEEPPEPQIITEATEWLEQTWHQSGCQCHRCLWARGVLGGRITQSFEWWRVRK